MRKSHTMRRGGGFTPHLTACSHGGVLSGILRPCEAHIENAAILGAVGILRILIRGLAGPQCHVVLRRVLANTLADIMVRARPHGRQVVEEALVPGDRIPSAVVGRIPIEGTAITTLAANPRRHRDPHVDVVRPTHHLHVCVQRKVDVDDMLVKVSLRSVHDGALGVVGQGGDTGHVRGRREAGARGLPVHKDLSVVHGAHHDRVAQQEGAADRDGMRGR
mmetsp:Transcript_74700/g.215812  ORF Transcript_74700/g.215812 Transcript_74700/m.215812 type:complete len:220 (+) Transcript_74700:146-805(+)